MQLVREVQSIVKYLEQAIRELKQCLPRHLLSGNGKGKKKRLSGWQM
jgi:hypothetical protein